jgi:lysophospholipase L1-like esterase
VPTTTSQGVQAQAVPSIGSSESTATIGRVGPHAGLGHPVAVIGDSIGAQSAPAIEREFANAGWGRVVIDAQPSRRIPQDKVTVPPYSGVAAVKKVRSKGFDPVTWVIELGTNDIMNTGDDPVALTALVTTMLDTIGPGHDVVWITVHNGVEPKAASTFNAILQRFDVARPDLVLGTWAEIADGKGLVSDDHIHLTPAGEQAFALDLVRAANRLVPDDPPAEARHPA